MASQRHKLATHNYGATCYSYEEKQVAIGYIKQGGGPYVQPTGPAGGPLKGSTLAGPPLAVLPGPQIENPLLALALILAGSQKPPEPPEPELPDFAIDVLDPNEAEIGGPDVTMTVTGIGFEDGAVIVFNGGDEPTEFVSETEVTTGVKPSTAGTPGTYPVAVRNPDGQVSNELGFTFTEPVARKTKAKAKRKT